MTEKYKIIYADPPWSYRLDRTEKTRWPARHYPTLWIEQLKKMNIVDLADKNCALFIWATFPNLQECLDLIKAWWFEYKTVAFTWVKKNKVANSWFWWMGSLTRSNAEICLYAKKWNIKRISAGVHSVIDTPIQKHSKKPEEVRKRIIELMGDIPKVELFAREKTEWWDVWWNEVDSDITLPSSI